MPGMCGGHKEVEIDNEIREHVNIALNAHNAESNEERKVLVTIKKATKQVVAGVKTVIDFIAEGENSKLQHDCHAELLTTAWIDPQPKLIKFETKPIEE